MVTWASDTTAGRPSTSADHSARVSAVQSVPPKKSATAP